MKHFVILDPIRINGLRVIDEQEYFDNISTVVDIYSGSQYECQIFANRYDENVPYPIDELEEELA